MHIRTALLPQLAEGVQESVCVVIDVLRATTSLAVLFNQGCPLAYIAQSHDDARRIARSQGLALCGETGGFKVEDFDYGNSPVEFSALDFTNLPIVLSTTNGTRAAALVAGAKRVFLGAAINRMAVARAAWETAESLDVNILLVCSGTDSQYTLEDATIAGLYVEALASHAERWFSPELDDASIACRRLWQNETNLLRGLMEGAHPRLLADLGFGEDVAYCAQIDKLNAVPILTSEEEAPTITSPVILAAFSED